MMIASDYMKYKADNQKLLINFQQNLPFQSYDNILPKQCLFIQYNKKCLTTVVLNFKNNQITSKKY